MAFLGAYLLHVLGNTKSAENNIEIALGAALLVGAAAMLLRFYLDRRKGHTRKGGGARPHRAADPHRGDRHDRRAHRRHDLGRARGR